MKLSRHRLEGEEYRSSPNQGGALVPSYVVMHYTATPSVSSAVGWLTDRRARASAHLVIGRDGEAVQLVPFNRVAWHAGRSRYDGLSGLNLHSIGIELENAGRLEETAAGGWRAWFGREYDEAEIMVAPHRSAPADLAGWPLYPEAQIMAAAEIVSLLAGRYAIREVIGHDDCAPGRKVDPGPAFPLSSFASRALGRNADDEPRHRPTVALNIRGGPGVAWSKIDEPLSTAERVVVLEARGSWRRVRVVGRDLEGWVHGAYLARIS